MKIAIIGAGNMGGAIALGLVSSHTVPASDISLTAAHKETLEKYASKGFVCYMDNVEAVREADVIFLAVKPWIVPEVIKQINPMTNGKLVVSVAPGVKAQELTEALAEGARIAYVIPNTAIEVMQSMTFVCPITANDADVELLRNLFLPCGEVMVVDEKHLDAGTALASCGIAYALRYIRAASEGGVELGFYAKDAATIVAQTVRGAAELMLAHHSHPEQEIDKVTTPGGMTIKGLNAMEAAGFTDAVIKGLKAGK